nr:MAG: ORF1 [Torque teno midi virus]
MPFWWRRRRKPWFGRWKRYTRKRRYNYKPKRRRFRRRRRNYRATRRRRRRYGKVRRKRKTITIKQHQPESIKKCKIKGVGVLVLGAQGTQYRCYTPYKTEWTNPKVSGGGGFGVELFTLQYLYNEYQAKQNIWTSSNEYRDLCRYTGCSFTVYRHPETDFIFAYDIQPPFTINKYTYMYMHPQLMLLRKKKRIILSTKTNPKGKVRHKIKIRPPKQLQTKWYFQEDFAKYGLVTVAATACNFRYPWLGCCNENLLITLYYLSPTFYPHTEWAQYHTAAYNPLGVGAAHKLPENFWYKYIDGKTTKWWQMTPFTGTNTYDQSVNINKGWFNQYVLRAVGVYDKHEGTTVAQAATPTGVLRYNPAEDTGKGNKIWITDVISGSWKEPKDQDLILEGYPLYMLLFGFTSYLKQVKSDSVNFQAKMLVVKSPALKQLFGADTQGWYPLLDKSFIYGKGVENTDPIPFRNNTWYPTLYAQRDSISAIVNCGPYTPKYNETKESTWQLNYNYHFYFKWGGSYPPIPEAENPANKNTYPVPSNMQEAIQIADPLKQDYNTIFKPWDYRRGQITKTALKRMQENIQSDESLSTDSTGCSSPKKKRYLPTLQDPKKENKKIQDCLLSLCEESTWQEPKEDSNIFQLIQQQYQQQQQLKHNLLTLIADLKAKQRNILHHTGFLG